MMTLKKLHSFSTSLFSALALILVLTVVSCEKDDPAPEAQATCDDGIQNGDETGVDCGGSCSACEEPVTMGAPDLNVAPIDMEETGYGPDFDSAKENNASNPTGTWGVFGSDEANKIALSIVDNPNPTGNTSAHVLSIVEQAGQEPWQGFFFDLESKVAFTGTNTAISVDVHSLRAGQRVLLKLEDKANSATNTGDIIVSTVGEGWETVVFNLSADYNGLFDRIVFIMDFGVVNDAVSNHYIDNIRVSAPAETTGGGGGEEAAPTEAPAAPSAAAADVISLFSDSYTDVTVDTWQTGWSNVGSYEEVDLGGNTVKKYSDLAFVGIETVSAQVDASGMTHFNLDMWSANATEFKIKLVDFGATGGYSGDGGDGQGDDVEHEYTVSTPAQGEWVTVSLSLADAFPGLTTTANIAQLILSAAPGGEADVFIDNVYFSTDGSNGGAAAGTYAPVYSGVFGGATKDGDVYTFPTGAETWAGFANENAEIYPLAFPNGGTITFTASSAGADVGVNFRFERLPHPDVDPAFNTSKATVSGTTATEYTIEIPAQDAANTFRSALMYLDTRDVAVTITNIEITVN